MYVHVCVCVCVCVCKHMHICKCVYVPVHVFIYRQIHECACVPACRHRRVGAGVTWSLVTSNAPWAARSRHTTVIDAAGTMYLIGGVSDTVYNDVWVSADKGAHRTGGGTQGGTQGVLKGYAKSTTRVLRGT
jgi:hypothetical protein